jgi:hypothetical protein
MDDNEANLNIENENTFINNDNEISNNIEDNQNYDDDIKIDNSLNNEDIEKVTNNDENLTIDNEETLDTDLNSSTTKNEYTGSGLVDEDEVDYSLDNEDDYIDDNQVYENDNIYDNDTNDNGNDFDFNQDSNNGDILDNSGNMDDDANERSNDTNDYQNNINDEDEIDDNNANNNENLEEKSKEEGEVHESGFIQHTNQKNGNQARNNKMNNMYNKLNKKMYPNKMPYNKRNMNMNRMYPMAPMNRPMLRNLNQKIYINPKFGLMGNNNFNNQFMRYNQPMYGNMNMMPMNPMMQPMMPMNPGMGYPEQHQRFFNPYMQNFQRPLMGYDDMYRKRTISKDKMMNQNNQKMYFDKQDGGRSQQKNNNNNGNNNNGNNNNGNTNDMETSNSDVSNQGKSNPNPSKIPNNITNDESTGKLRQDKKEDQMDWRNDNNNNNNKDSVIEFKKEDIKKEMNNFNLRPAHHNSKSQNISVGTIQRFKNININSEENSKSEINQSMEDLSPNTQNQGQFSVESLLS